MKPGGTIEKNGAESSGQTPKGLRISGSESYRKETWRQQFESAPGYHFLFIILMPFYKLIILGLHFEFPQITLRTFESS